ncbi:MAG: hypothetical protein NZZ41_01160 [Candidatus Dojkabacteria bacterium]|nr:hypothetical protein [Candidatus Dojkabacteria bacterium]
MDRSEKEKLIKYMLENRKKELEELEKGIVLLTLRMESMIGIHSDIQSLAAMRKRRDELEEEYEKVKEEISLLESGVIPEQKKEFAIEKAKKHLHECMELKNKFPIV